MVIDFNGESSKKFVLNRIVTIKEILMMILISNMEKEQRLLVDAVQLSRGNFGISAAVVMAIVRQAKSSIASSSDKPNWFSVFHKDHAIGFPSLNHVFFCALVMGHKNVIRKFSKINL